MNCQIKKGMMLPKGEQTSRGVGGEHARYYRNAYGAGLSAEATIGRILETVVAFKGDAPQGDDMTCVVVRVEGRWPAQESE